MPKVKTSSFWGLSTWSWSRTGCQRHHRSQRSASQLWRQCRRTLPDPFEQLRETECKEYCHKTSCCWETWVDPPQCSQQRRALGTVERSFFRWIHPCLSTVRRFSTEKTKGIQKPSGNIETNFKNAFPIPALWPARWLATETSKWRCFYFRHLMNL